MGMAAADKHVLMVARRWFDMLDNGGIFLLVPVTSKNSPLRFMSSRIGKNHTVHVQDFVTKNAWCYSAKSSPVPFVK